MCYQRIRRGPNSAPIIAASSMPYSALRRLRLLIDAIEPMFVSDHLSWSRIDGFNSHDLLPLPYTEDALALVCENIDRAQEVLGRTLLIENPSSYIAWPGEMAEWTGYGAQPGAKPAD